MPEIISRKEAKARGLKRYFTGKPCKHGHVCERYVSSFGTCIECSRPKRIAYSNSHPEYRRRWLKKLQQQHPERFAEFAARSARRKHKYKMNGPSNPIGEKQWLRKNQAQLRALRRALKASRSQSGASTPAPNSPA